MVARAERMRSVLRIALDCGCFRLEDCGPLLDGATGPIDGRSPCVMPAGVVESARRASPR